MAPSPVNILGLSAFYHDSAAALLRDGRIIAAAQEERFSRTKHDAGFPAGAVDYCLKEGGLALGDVDHIVFYDKPLLKFDRLLETYLAFAPRGLQSFVASMPIWLKEKLYLKQHLRRRLAQLGDCKPTELPRLLFTQHHQSHAASAFFPSPFDEAAVLCLDGVGEWATTSLWLGKGSQLTPLWELHFPHSLGLLYSAFTYFTGFKVNSGEYKLMGLAPYGEPKYKKLILEQLLDLKPDGTFHLNMRYFDFATGLRMVNRRFAALFGRPPRSPESELRQSDMDLAASVQAVTEEIVLRLAQTAYRETGCHNLCLAGGVALNCVANGRILREGPFKNIWVQPASGDAGGALGAALAAWHTYLDQPREHGEGDRMQGAYLGPQFSIPEIEAYLESAGAPYIRLENADLAAKVAQLLDAGQVVGWFQGRMEFGPRALGNRSILGDPRNQQMQARLNLKIKFRESFRPFAPAVLEEDARDFFDIDCRSPYMLLVADVLEERRLPTNHDALRDPDFDLLEIINSPRSDIPAVTHVDHSARIQTVDGIENPELYNIIRKFKELSGFGVVVNTSFNVRGEPIVCTPWHAYTCFMRTEMDLLVLEDVLLWKKEQPLLDDDSDWRKTYELD
ncbi:MAG: carbamoyltransferase [Candidatus Marinimicrobia bacterium]|nr:carbamoyltransferase [Candidatus Neomarinimicrobiota bacterium]